MPVVTLPSGTLCSGTSAIYTASSSGATSYHWSVTGTGWSGASTTASITATVGTGAGQLIVYGTNACGNGPSDTINVTPTALPTLPSVALSGTLPCVGAITANYTGTSTGATSYNWTVLGTGWSGSSTTSAITVTLGTGSGTIICQGVNACGVSANDTVTLSPSALPGLPTVTPPATVPCTGAATYTANSIGATSYNWSVTGTGWSGASVTNTLIANVGTGTGQIIVYGTNACGNGPSDTLNVTPTAGATIPVVTLGSPLPCSGSATTATYNATSTGATSFTWNIIGTGWSGSSTTGTINVTIGTGVGMIICQGVNVCGSSTADTVNVTPSPLPTPPSLSLVGTVPCVTATSAQYFANSVGATSYTWTVLGSGWSGSSATDTLNLTVGTGTATIICTGTNSCGTSTADTAYLTPSSGVGVASPILSTSSICQGGTATFVTSGIGGATSYAWVVTGAGWSGTSTSTMITLIVGTAPATISVYGTSACGTGASYTLYSVIPVALPNASFSIAYHIVGVGTNDLVTYTGSASASGTYTWDFGGGTASPGFGVGPNLVNWSTTGLKTLTLSVSDSGCNSVVFTDTVLVIAAVGVNDIINNTSVNIMPNPNNGSFKIVFDGEVNNAIAVKLTDIQGRVVYENRFEGAKDKTLSIDAQNLPNAVYTATIVTEGEVINKKVLINR